MDRSGPGLPASPTNYGEPYEQGPHPGARMDQAKADSPRSTTVVLVDSKQDTGPECCRTLQLQRRESKTPPRRIALRPEASPQTETRGSKIERPLALSEEASSTPSPP